MEMMRIHDSLPKRRRFVVLVALSFWMWLGRDLVFQMIGVELLGGQLLAVCTTVLLLLFIAGRPGNTRVTRRVDNLRARALMPTLLFFGYCALSGFVSGQTAFTTFKLQSLLISIVVAYALAHKVVCAIAMDKRQFFLVGILFGLAAYYTVFSDLAGIMESEEIVGLRAMKVAHLNVQDLYVVLFLYGATLLFAGQFRRVHLYLFLGAGALCAPVVVGMNSRMVPFTVGITFIYMAVALRSVMAHRRNQMRNVMFLVVFTVGGVAFVGDLVGSESRMMRVFDGGLVNCFVQGPRYVSFDEALWNFRESPVYGIGFAKFAYPGTNPDPTDRLAGTWPHNIFLELLSELGIIGLLLFIILGGRTLKRVLFVQIESNREFLAFPCLVLVYVFATMQLTHLIAYPPLWVGFFCCDAAFHYDRYSFSGLKRTDTAESV